MKILVLGAGLVGGPMAMDLANDPQFEVYIADIDQKKLDTIPEKFPINKQICDVTQTGKLKQILVNFDMVLSAVPGYLGFQTLKTIIESGKNVVDISFFPEDPFSLNELAKKQDVFAIMDCGVAPGMSYILAKHASLKFDVCNSIEIYVGGLPKIRLQPFEYKAVFSPIDVIEEYTRPARYRKDNKEVIKPALSECELMEFDGIGTLEAFNSDGLRSLLKTIDCPNMIEKTLRYPGHVEKMKLLREIGLFSEKEVILENKTIKPIELTSKLLFPMWEMKEGDEDITVMKIIVKGRKDNKKSEISYYLYDYFDTVSGVHSMARTTGYTATMAVRMLAKGLYPRKGLSVPEFIGEYPDCVQFMLKGLKERNIIYHESLNTEK
jgi:lysine 6-dehydrogenase